MTTTARGTVLLRHPAGLHARPAIKFTRLAKSFPLAVRIRGTPGGVWVNAKSIVRVMSLKLGAGAWLELEVEGEGAHEVLDALTALVERDFDDRA